MTIEPEANNLADVHSTSPSLSFARRYAGADAMHELHQIEMQTRPLWESLRRNLGRIPERIYGQQKFMDHYNGIMQRFFASGRGDEYLKAQFRENPIGWSRIVNVLDPTVALQDQRGLFDVQQDHRFGNDQNAPLFVRSHVCDWISLIAQNERVTWPLPIKILPVTQDQLGGSKESPLSISYDAPQVRLIELGWLINPDTQQTERFYIDHSVFQPALERREIIPSVRFIIQNDQPVPLVDAYIIIRDELGDPHPIIGVKVLTGLSGHQWDVLNQRIRHGRQDNLDRQPRPVPVHPY